MKKKSVSMILQSYLLLIAAIVVGIVFGAVENSFFKPTNLVEIVRAASIIGLMGLGETVVQSAGEMDFAVGAETSFGAVMIAIMMTQLNLNFGVSFILTMILVILIGVLNSIIVVKVGIPSFVATLGMNTFINGINKYLTGGGTYYSTHWPDGFSVLGKSSLFNAIPMPAVLFIIGSVIVWVFLSKTRTGRYIYAVGANPNASKNVGIDVGKHKMIAFIVCAVCGGFAGMLQCSILNAATPTAGDSNFLKALSTCMLGATFLTPGVYNIPGTFVGAIMLGIIDNGLTMVGASYFMKDIINGLVLILAVGMVSLSQKKTKLS